MRAKIATLRSCNGDGNGDRVRREIITTHASLVKLTSSCVDDDANSAILTLSENTKEHSTKCRKKTGKFPFFYLVLLLNKLIEYLVRYFEEIV